MQSESTQNISALLITYLSTLPEPLLSPPLFEPFWTWCVNPTLDRDTLHDDAQIKIAQSLLYLLPSPNFSLFLYLFSFFTQILLYPENGINIDDLARIFAFNLLGGSSKPIARRMMVWILRRWTRISAGLRIIHSPDLGLQSPTEPASRIGKLPLSHVKEPDHHQDGTSCPLSERSSSSESLDSSAACKLINLFLFFF